MPMPTNEDHGAQNPDNPYCMHCTDCDGKLLPFEKKFDELVASTMETRWMSREEAERIARERKERPLVLVDIAMPRDIDP